VQSRLLDTCEQVKASSVHLHEGNVVIVVVVLVSLCVALVIRILVVDRNRVPDEQSDERLVCQ
jgi:uncharacterized protein (DUF486 family)